MRKKKKTNEVVKALHRAERDLQFERNGYDHPWVSITVAHKNKKHYNRKRDRKNFNYYSDGLYIFLIFIVIKNITHPIVKITHIMMVS